MTEGKVEFELVSPERLLMSETVDMVVVPGAEGDFGVLPRHSLLISAVRRGVIQAWKNNTVSDRIFVAGGFCEVTAERCTVLAEEGVRVDDIDKDAIQAELKNLREDAADAKTPDERSAVESRIAIHEAMLEAAG
ncbi:MAG: ATP synthase F1 subunit epsilon [Rhodospirillaceae bacterium]|nr:ATP synthase F1 subunit epsilon [Rhodospirillaceae bacterium]